MGVRSDSAPAGLINIQRVFLPYDSYYSLKKKEKKEKGGGTVVKFVFVGEITCLYMLMHDDCPSQGGS